MPTESGTAQTLIREVAARTTADGVLPTAIARLSLYRRTAVADCNPSSYIPRLIVFLQGRKSITLSEARHDCGPGDFLLTSVDLPVSSRIEQASPAEPLYALLLELDMALVREVVSQNEPDLRALPRAQGMVRGQSTPELLSACLRLVQLLDDPAAISYLSPLLEREILYRLLRSPQGQHLRAIATLGDQSHRTAKAVAWLRDNYQQPLRVEDLAQLAQMGVSTFHHHFRALTDMSPVQYQKRLRLHAARARLLSGSTDAAEAAYAVGYESPSQFSREYRRLFGQSPIRSVQGIRGSNGREPVAPL